MDFSERKSTRNPADKRFLNYATAELKRRTAQFRNAAFRSFIQDINNSSANYVIRKAVKSLKQRTKRHIPIKGSCQNWCRSHSTKAEALASHLESTFTPHSVPMKILIKRIFQFSTYGLRNLPILLESLRELLKHYQRR